MLAHSILGTTGAALLLLVGCRTHASDGDRDLTDNALASAAEPISFAPCSLVTFPPEAKQRAECATIDVPLDWENPAGRRASFFVKRLRGSAPGVHRQVWLLQGGPGGDGSGFERFVERLAPENATTDFYMPDHRGTGRSTFFDCPEAAAAGFDMAACGAELKRIWGEDGLKTFTTTTAARDLGSVIERTREPGQEVHVYGVSYGTYWAQRYLQLFPTQPTAVTLDGICQSGLCSVRKFDYYRDRVGKRLLRDCVADPVCGEKLGPDPVAKVREAIAVADAGTCRGLKGVDGKTWRSVLGAFIVSMQVRGLIPALVYRTLRCSDNDVVALENTLALLFPPSSGSGTSSDPADGGEPPPERPQMFSLALFAHIAFSEMEESPVATREELKALLADAVFATYSPTIADDYDAWPRYARDRWVGQYPTTRVPVLLLNGTHDAQTPIEFADEVAQHYTAAGQRYVSIPWASHGTVLGASPTAADPRVSCGFLIWNQFVGRPTGKLDTSCTTATAAIAFAAAPIGGELLGTEDLFEGIAVPRPPADPRRSAEVARLIAEIRRNMRRPSFGF